MLSHAVPLSAPNGARPRTLSVVTRLLAVFAILIGILPAPQTAFAASGSYGVKWYAADPAVSRAPYLPTYVKQPPSSLACPGAGLSGGAGRAADPLANAVAYASPATSNNLDAVTSLAPKDLALGQIVPFEVEITVNGSTAPENGVISFTPYWLTKTTSGDDFGYDPAYKVYCAFVDTADPGTSDPGGNAKVASWTSTVANTGTNNEQIQGTINVAGLDNGDKVIVEIWVVLKSTIPAGSTGNVQTGLVSAQTATGDTINTGNQTVPLLRVREFFTSSADVSVTKSDSPDPVALGGQLTYTIVATNNSADTIANGVVVTDKLDPNTTFVSGTWSGGVCTAASGTVTCNVGSLAQGQSATITIVVTVNNNAPTSGTVQTGSCTVGAPGVDLCNTVSVSTITSDPNTANNSASAPTNVVGAPALSLTKTASPATYSKVGDVVSYSYVLKNTGNVALSAPYAVSDDKTTVTCPQTPSPLTAGASITCSATYVITQADLDTGSVTNKATGTAGFSGSTVTSNQAQATVTAVKAPALSLTKSASPITYSALNQSIQYSYVVKNTGNVTLAGPFTVADDKATVSCPATTSLAPGASITCTATYTITQADLDAGSVTNKATATNGTVTSNQAQATVTAVKAPALSLTKSANPQNYDAVGQAISYSYVIVNTGNVTLVGPFTVADDKATVSCPATTSLAPGASITCTASYAITQADLDSGSVTNHATATDGTLTSNPAEATVNAVQAPALSLDKTVQEENYAKVGDVLHYSYLVTNSGNVTLHDAVTVSDDKTTATCPALPAGGLAPGASITCNASYTVSQADLDGGSVTNVASATSGTMTSLEDTVTVEAAQSPALKLTKSAGTAKYQSVGQIVGYSYELKNTGNVTLAGPFTVADDKTTATCPAAASLAPGATLTCTASYAITQADLDNGAVTNHATAQGFFGGSPVPSNPAQATVTAEQKPALALNKTAQEENYAKAGDVLHYSYLVTNAGNVTLHDAITVSDDKTTVTCPALPVGGLAPGASINCTASYTVSQADVDNGKVMNTATAKSGAVTSPSDSATVPATQRPQLGLTKSASPSTYTKTGDVITYGYVLKNSGNVTLSGPFTVSDDKIAVTCPSTPASLAPNATLTCTATYTIKQSDLDGGSIANVASAAGTFGGNPVTSPTDTATVYANQTPVLQLTKKGSPETYSAVGQAISYSYELKNAGNVTLSGPFTVTDDKTTVSCPSTPSTLAPGATLTCTATYAITQADLDAGSVTNKAKAQAYFNGSPVLSDQAQYTVNAVQNGKITLVKTAAETTYVKVGDVLHYSYVIKNTGNISLSGPFKVTDDKATVTCPTGSLAPGASLTCTASYTIKQSDLDAGAVTNHATATNGKVTSNQDQVTVPATQKSDLTLTKSANPLTYNVAGQTISYSYVLKNTGNVTLSGPFTVTDDKTTVTCPASPATLAPGASLNCTATYTVTQADLDAGSVTNHATAYAKFGATTLASNEAEATVNAVQSPAISLVKSASPATYGKVGDVITYSYVVKNTGNVTLPGPFSISDDKLGTISCPAGALAPGASVTCTKSYTIVQSNLDGGSITNTATASTSYGAQTVTSNPSSATVTAQQKPALTLTKVANPLTYSAVGQVIVYTYVAQNTGNVTLSGPFMVTDDKLGTFQCGAATSLAPGAAVTCTKSYTIQASDLNATYNASITNRATAAGKFGATSVTSNQAQATVSQVRPSGQIAPTQTTCSDFANGVAADLTELAYNVKGSQINNVAPGVLFYYSKVTAPASSFTIQVVQTNDKSFPALSVQQETSQWQAILWSANCTKAGAAISIAVDPATQQQTVTYQVTGATVGQVYYVGIKYSPKPLVGFTVRTPYPTLAYTFYTVVGNNVLQASQDSLYVMPK